MKTVRAVFEVVVFRPIDQVDLQENSEVEFEPRVLSENTGKESAIKLFQNDEVSLGKAAQIAGMDRWTFKELLKERGITVEIETAPVKELEQAVSEIQHMRNP